MFAVVYPYIGLQPLRALGKIQDDAVGFVEQIRAFAPGVVGEDLLDLQFRHLVQTLVQDFEAGDVLVRGGRMTVGALADQEQAFGTVGKCGSCEREKSEETDELAHERTSDEAECGLAASAKPLTGRAGF